MLWSNWILQLVFPEQVKIDLSSKLVWQKGILIKVKVKVDLIEVNKIPSRFPFVNDELVKSCMKAQLLSNQIRFIIDRPILASVWLTLVLIKHTIAHLLHSILALNLHFQFVSKFISNHNLNPTFSFLNQRKLYPNLHFSVVMNLFLISSIWLSLTFQYVSHLTLIHKIETICKFEGIFLKFERCLWTFILAIKHSPK